MRSDRRRRVNVSDGAANRRGFSRGAFTRFARCTLEQRPECCGRRISQEAGFTRPCPFTTAERPVSRRRRQPRGGRQLQQARIPSISLRTLRDLTCRMVAPQRRLISHCPSHKSIAVRQALYRIGASNYPTGRNSLMAVSYSLWHTVSPNQSIQPTAGRSEAYLSHDFDPSIAD